MVSPRPTSFTGMPELGLDGEHDAALGRAVELGEHDAGDLGGRRVNSPGLGEAVLAGRGVDHEQHLGDAARLPCRPPGAPCAAPPSGWSWCAGGRRCRPARGRRRGRWRAATASKITALGSPPSLPRTKSAPVRSAQVASCSAAAARNVSPAAISTRRPSATCWAPTLPIVVVLPTPLTPTNSHTLGEPAAPARSAASRSAPSSRRLHLGLQRVEQLRRAR